MRATALTVFLLSTLAPMSSAVEERSLVFINGLVRTMDARGATAEAVAVESGRIVHMGERAEVERAVAGPARVVDMCGGVLFPGFTDAHTHPVTGGSGLLELSFTDKDGAAAIKEKLKDYASAHPDLEWIYGIGWSLTQFPYGNPHKSVIDDAVADRPVVLVDSNSHSAWANSEALRRAGITMSSPDPLNGKIERDLDTGEPSGTLRESAQKLVLDLVPAPSSKQYENRLRAGLAYENANGYTAFVDASTQFGGEEDAYLQLARRGELTARVLLALLPGNINLSQDMTLDDVDRVVAALVARRTALAKESIKRLSANMVKILLDGGLESCTAAFLQPYADAGCGPGHVGAMTIREPVLNAYVRALHYAGFQVHFHSIGDRTTRVALNAIEKAAPMRRGTSRDRRHTVSHLQFVHPEDASRFKTLGVYANFQALWAFPYDHSMDPFVDTKIGKWLYPLRTLRDAGAVIVSGSDWPVSTANPFHAMEVAVLRKDQSNPRGRVLLPEQSVDVDDVMRALTVNGAKLMHQENIRGTIEVGKAGDLVLLDRDPYSVEPHDLSEIRVNLTVFDGRIVYQREDFRLPKAN